MDIKKTAILALFLAGTIMVGCDNNDEVVAVYDPPPQPPQGVYTVTGNDTVYVNWAAPYEGDLAFFGVYRSALELTGYARIALIDADPNPNLDLVYYGYKDGSAANGETYYYAVTSIDKAGQESGLSAETAFDTPRPDGEVTLYDEAIDAARAAFDFATRAVVASDNAAADVYVDRDQNSGVFYLNASNADVVIQSLGYHYAFDEVGWSPEAPYDGWSYNGWSEIVTHHVYVIAIKNAHGDWNYAKMRVLEEEDAEGRVRFQWAYQTDENNPELAPPVGESGRRQDRPAAGSGI